MSNFWASGDAIGIWLATHAATSGKAMSQTVLAGAETSALARLAHERDPGRWLDARDRIEGLLARVEGLNLDRKAAMMDAFFQAREAVRANPRAH